MPQSRETRSRWRRQISHHIERGLSFIFPSPASNGDHDPEPDQSPLVQKNAACPNTVRYDSRGRRRCSRSRSNSPQRSADQETQEHHCCEHCCHRVPSDVNESAAVRARRRALVCPFCTEQERHGQQREGEGQFWVFH